MNSAISMFEWDNIPVFLALYRERTTSRAAETLGCSQPTVTRRIAGLEHALDLRLFTRTPTGLTPTASADALFPLAQQVERSMCAFDSEVAALAGTGQNEIRLTFLDHFERLLVPVLRGFRERWPMVNTQLLASDKMYDFSRGEADIGIRGRSKPDTDDIVSTTLPPTGWTVFASSHSEPADRPRSPEEVGDYPIALLESSAGRLPVYKWLEQQARAGTTTIRCSNYSALKSAIASGAAVSVLPFTVGHREPDLVPCFPPMQEFDVTIYLIARRAILRRPPGRDLYDSIAAYFEAHPELLTGPRR